MKTIKVTKAIMVKGKLQKPGATVEVDDGLARTLVLRERATLVEAKGAKASDDPKK